MKPTVYRVTESGGGMGNRPETYSGRLRPTAPKTQAADEIVSFKTPKPACRSTGSCRSKLYCLKRKMPVQTNRETKRGSDVFAATFCFLSGFITPAWHCRPITVGRESMRMFSNRKNSMFEKGKTTCCRESRMMRAALAARSKKVGVPSGSPVITYDSSRKTVSFKKTKPAAFRNSQTYGIFVFCKTIPFICEVIHRRMVLRFSRDFLGNR